MSNLISLFHWQYIDRKQKWLITSPYQHQITTKNLQAAKRLQTQMIQPWHQHPCKHMGVTWKLLLKSEGNYWNNLLLQAFRALRLISNQQRLLGIEGKYWGVEFYPINHYSWEMRCKIGDGGLMEGVVLSVPNKNCNFWNICWYNDSFPVKIQREHLRTQVPKENATLK